MPTIKITFPNPLNTSVQIGDIAYFSNPIEVGGIGNPSGGQWASTTTPHLTGEQQDIIKIGEIIGIEPWNGSKSVIHCDMPQILFNKYFNDLVPITCVTTPDPNNPCSGPCCNYTLLTDIPVHNSGSYPSPHYPPPYPDYDYIDWLWDNPTVSRCDIAYHHATSAAVAGSNLCLVDPNQKSVNSVWGQGNPHGFNDYISAPGWINYWFKLAPLTNSFNNSSVDTFLTSTPCMSANDILNGLMTLYPGDYSLGMTFNQMNSARNDVAVYGGAVGPITGSSGGFTTICDDGSFIMFSKDNKVNMSSMLGYYASIEYRNDSLEKAELFKVGAEVFESSK